METDRCGSPRKKSETGSSEELQELEKTLLDKVIYPDCCVPWRHKVKPSSLAFCMEIFESAILLLIRKRDNPSFLTRPLTMAIMSGSFTSRYISQQDLHKRFLYSSAMVG